MRFVNVCLASVLGLWPAIPGVPLQDPAGGDESPATLSFRSLKELLTAFGKVKSFSAAFAEEKQIELLLKPIQSRGVVYYHAAGQDFARHVVAPFPHLLVVDPEQVAVREEGKWMSTNKGGQPVVRQFLASFLKILQGDSKGLQELYVVDFSAPEAENPLWTLALTPRRSPMNKIITSVTLSGRGLEVAAMRVLEACGDRTVTTFSKVQVDREFTEKEMAQLFPKPPAVDRDR